MNRKVLGVDCGKVILHQMNGTPIPGALDALRTINQSGVFESIWIVSKCGPRVQALTRTWLADLGFWRFTGIPDSNIRFCLDYQGKHPICQELGVTHFVDDRPLVLDCLTSVDILIAFQPKPNSLRDYRQNKPLHFAHSWADVLRLVL